MRLTILFPTRPTNPSTIVRYVSLSWLLLTTTHSFCPPRQTHHHRWTLHAEEPGQLTLSQLETIEEARLDSLEESLAQKRDALQNKRLNEMFAEEDIERKRRQEEIDLLLENDDAVWREERKKRMMGKFAGLERGEVEEILREEMEKEVAGELIFLFIV
jgi:uncharacterized coiled-coil protein SlyX